MTSAICPITQATPADIGRVAELVAGAFHPLAASRWLVPEPAVRQATLAGQFALIVEQALAFGHIDLLADGSGAAVWLHRTEPIPAPVDYDQRLDAGGIPAYLEAADLRCRALYAREGYVALTPFVLPDSDARFHPMWRPPHPRLHPLMTPDPVRGPTA